MDTEKPVDTLKEGVELEKDVPLKQEPTSAGKSEAKEKELDFGEVVPETPKKIDFMGMKVFEDDLKLQDWNCVLHVNPKLSTDLQMIVANIYVEFANISSPEQLERDGLPAWPLKEPWIHTGQVPALERRTFAFRALINFFVQSILDCEKLQDCDEEIGHLEFVDLMSRTKLIRIKKLGPGEEIKSEDVPHGEHSKKHEKRELKDETMKEEHTICPAGDDKQAEQKLDKSEEKVKEGVVEKETSV